VFLIHISDKSGPL